VTREEPRFLSREEVGRLTDATGPDGDVVRPLAYTGLRFGDVAAFRVRRVDFLRRYLTIAEAVTEVGGRLEFGTPKPHQSGRSRYPQPCSNRWPTGFLAEVTPPA
jgi:integrase